MATLRSKKKNEEKQEELGNVTTFKVEFTRAELAHIRDLFSIRIPPELKTTLSEALAESQERQLIETRLWEKLTAVITKSGVPMGENAPDFTVLPTGAVPLGVFQIEMTDSQVAKTHGIRTVEDEEDE